MKQSWAIACALACGCGRVGFEEPEGALGVSYPSPDIDAVLGKSAIMLAPTVDGGPARFGVEPELPAGLALDRDTGVLSGTPMELVDGIAYTITATGDRGVARVALRITALPGSIVDSVADAYDDDGGLDDVCRASTAGGGCTLRAALETANLRTTKQLILLDARAYAVETTFGELRNDVVIAGRSAAETAIRSATIHGGFGMIYILGGHALTLKRATFRDFGPTDGAVAAVKGGSLLVDAASFTNNLSAGSGGVVLVRDGSTAVIERSTFTGNASLGGCCGGWGGVIHGEGAGTSIVVRQCTASENTAAWGSFSHISEGTKLTLENSTLYRNTARTAGTLASPGGTYTLRNSTIVHNTNTEQDSAGIFLYSTPAEYTVENTILAFNRDGSGLENNCNHRTPDTRVVSRGGNLLSDGGGNCGLEFVMPGDGLAVDPGIDPNGLADHGGPTSTIMLTEGSIAIGRALGCPAVDQRGVARPEAPARCDAGAVEVP
jgi:CSLREA domain-containing protein